MAYAPHNPWTAGEKDAAAKLQTLTDALLAIGNPWQSWTPVLTSTGTAPTTTVTGGYVHAGRLVIFEFAITIVTAGTGNYTISLPVTAAGLFPKAFVTASCYDQSAGLLYPRIGLSVGSNTTFVLNNDDSSRVSQTSPFTFAVNDVIAGTGTYQAATNP
jgi:hypothetical protein